MQKKLLILLEGGGLKKKYFGDYISKKLFGDKVVLANFSDLLFKVSPGNVDIEISGCPEKITDFDFVHIRRSGQKYLSEARAVAIFLKANKVNFGDKTFADVGPSGNDKFVDGIRLALGDLPVIPFFYCAREKLDKWRQQIIGFFGYPFVVKNIYSQRGEGVYLVRDENGFGQLLEKADGKNFLFQKYIPSNEEYRILILDGAVGAYEEKINNNPDEFRANVVLGASERFIKNEDIPDDTRKISIKACEILNLGVGGVDILVDKDKNKWLLEVNRGPGLTYEPEVSPELDSFVAYFSKKLNEN